MAETQNHRTLQLEIYMHCWSMNPKVMLLIYLNLYLFTVFANYILHCGRPVSGIHGNTKVNKEIIPPSFSCSS